MYQQPGMPAIAPEEIPATGAAPQYVAYPPTHGAPPQDGVPSAEQVPVAQAEQGRDGPSEDDMQAPPGIFTNERGNLKASASVARVRFLLLPKLWQRQGSNIHLVTLVCTRLKVNLPTPPLTWAVCDHSLSLPSPAAHAARCASSTWWQFC